jgi:hypothetical protein
VQYHQCLSLRCTLLSDHHDGLWQGLGLPKSHQSLLHVQKGADCDPADSVQGYHELFHGVLADPVSPSLIELTRRLRRPGTRQAPSLSASVQTCPTSTIR